MAEAIFYPYNIQYEICVSLRPGWELTDEDFIHLRSRAIACSRKKYFATLFHVNWTQISKAKASEYIPSSDKLQSQNLLEATGFLDNDITMYSGIKTSTNLGLSYSAAVSQCTKSVE